MKRFNFKKFLLGTIILLPILLVVDIGYDKIFKTLIWEDTFAMKNLVFKILAAFTGAYFYATYNTESSNES